MELTGTNRDQFDEWADKNFEGESNKHEINTMFIDLPFEMQSGVYRKYFAEKHNIVINTDFECKLEICTYSALDYSKNRERSSHENYHVIENTLCDGVFYSDVQTALKDAIETIDKYLNFIL